MFLVFVGQPEQKLVPYKGLKFRIKEFSDVVYERVIVHLWSKQRHKREGKPGSFSCRVICFTHRSPPTAQALQTARPSPAFGEKESASCSN